MRSGKKRLLAVGITGVVVAFGSIALADSKTIQDPQDRPSGEGGIDIKSASHGHTTTGKLKHKIVAYNRVNDTYEACLFIKTDADEFYSCGYQMYNSADQEVGDLTEARPDSRTIVFKFRPSVIGDPSSYTWWVEAGNYCQQCDRAPNTGRVRHTL